MANYDFSVLNDKEFEALVLDLLQADFDVRIERFKPGKDSGIDGRFFCPQDANHPVIQVKHWQRSGYRALSRYARNEERYKVNSLKPERYIFATSVSLSPRNKSELLSIFKPHIRNTNDIIGADDINNLLETHKSVEVSHYKLWICSVNILKRILHNDVIGRTAERLEQYWEFQPKYVKTTHHDNAINILESHNVLLLSGAPGIGKTTLANALCLSYAAESFTPIFIEESITEAEKVYSEHDRQLFYFDDFLGSNYLSALRNDQDSHVVHFINRVRRDPSKRFILTSRTNILRQGWRLTQKFELNNLQRHQYELSLSEVTVMNRARILYNHMWFGGLPEELIDVLYEDKRYKKIINHQNFNPRLISFITDPERLAGIAIEGYWDYIQSLLDNPHDVWRHAFDSQLDDLARGLVELTVFNGSRIEEQRLRDAYNRMIELGLIVYSGHLRKEFFPNVKSITGSFLNRIAIGTGQIVYTPFTPSISDYIVHEYANDNNRVTQLLSCLLTSKSIRNLKGLVDSGIMAVGARDTIISTLAANFNGASRESTGFWVSVWRAVLCEELPVERSLVGRFIKEIDLDYIDTDAVYDLLRFSDIALNLSIIPSPEKYVMNLLDSLTSHTLDNVDLELTALLLDKVGDSLPSTAKTVFSDIIRSYWEEEIDSYAAEIEEVSDILDYEDVERIYEKVTDSLEQEFLQYGEFGDTGIISDVIGTLDAVQIVEDNRDRVAREDHLSEEARDWAAFDVQRDDVDDLFEKA